MHLRQALFVTATLIAFVAPQLVLAEAALRMAETADMAKMAPPVPKDGPKVIAECAAVKCTTIDLTHALEADYSTLAGMPHIDRLMVSYTDLSSLDPLLAMTQLTELHIGGTKVQDLSEIGQFTKLELLHAQGLGLSDISAVGQLGELKELVIGSPHLSDITALKNLHNLKRLDLTGAPVSDISALTALSNLETIELLNMSQLKDISPLLDLPNLKHVSVTVANLDAAGQDVVARLKAKGIHVQAFDMMAVC
ncbi:hypothetical protein KO498_02855 [Lentibacter algarum]|uniref:leucine-rich repeat domain-containing protein n=1 Tax=Lentibacter algarum TaxID=576131 RepID=UPI001C07C54B|nr:leucine-rich repeat domain-containing protein [Lentibacter algarum]MBU2980745.1 hypothetical protein [Lentibacter algarum]